MKYLLLLFSLIFTSALSAQFTTHSVIDSTATGITEIVTADLNNDGLKDVIVPQKYTQNNKVSYYINQDNGQFDSPVQITSIYHPLGVAAGDLNNNGWNDLAIIGGSYLRICYNDNGSFSYTEDIDTTLNSPFSVKIADIDNDNDQDIILICDVEFFVYYNNGDSTYVKTLVDPGIITENYDLELADLNNDGWVDVVIGGVKLLIYQNNNGVIEFDSTATATTGINSLVLVVDLNDLDGDSLVDVICEESGLNGIKWLKNDGSANFTMQPVFESETSVCMSIKSGDFDQDGDNDVLTTFNQSGKVVWYENDGFGNFSPQINIHTGLVPFTERVQCDDMNNDGKIDALWAHDLSVSLNGQSLSLDNYSQDDFRFYPNPTKGDIVIETDNDGELIIYDLQGKVIQRIPLNQGISTLNLEIPPATYITEIISHNSIQRAVLIISK